MKTIFYHLNKFLEKPRADRDPGARQPKQGPAWRRSMYTPSLLARFGRVEIEIFDRI